MTSHVRKSNRLISVFPDLLHGRVAVTKELELKDPLSPQVSWGDIHTELGNKYNTALWLDGDCFLVSRKWRTPGIVEKHRHRRYRIHVKLSEEIALFFFELYQTSATTERRGAPLPALEYVINRLTNIDQVHSFDILPCNDFDDDQQTMTLDISPACFSGLLQSSRAATEAASPLTDRPFISSVTLSSVSLTSEQTMMLFTHDSNPIFLCLDRCCFHGHTLRQLGLSGHRPEQTHLMGGASYLSIMLADDHTRSISLGELTGLLSNPHLRYFSPYSKYSDNEVLSYETITKLVCALEANSIPGLVSLHLNNGRGFEWERKEEPSAWIDFWKAIEQHPSLKKIHIDYDDKIVESYWQPIAAVVKVNPCLVLVSLRDRVINYRNTNYCGIELHEHVEPLLERNRYRPKIAALCCSEPSKAAALLGQAIVAVGGSKEKHTRCKREIIRMLIDQLVLTGHDFVGGTEWLLGKKPLAK